MNDLGDTPLMRGSAWARETSQGLYAAQFYSPPGLSKMLVMQAATSDVMIDETLRMFRECFKRRGCDDWLGVVYSTT